MIAPQETTLPSSIASLSGAAQTAPAKAAGDKTGDFTFSDLLDVINPLQHIPVIDTLYRSLTGDSISPAARIAGDTLYGGVFGLIGSVADSLLEGETGKDLGSHIMATLFGDDDAASTPSTAAASTPQTALSTAAVGTIVPSAVTSAAQTPAPVAGPTSYFQSLQHAAHGSHAVPLNASVPVPKGAVTGKSVPTQGSAPATAPATSTMPAPTSLLPGSNAATPPASPMASSQQSDSALVASVPGTALPAMMMKALDKYRTLETERSQAVAQTNSAALMN